MINQVSLCVSHPVCRRFVRCIRVVCCQQEAYADANKVLFSKRLRFMKVRGQQQDDQQAVQQQQLSLARLLYVGWDNASNIANPASQTQLTTVLLMSLQQCHALQRLTSRQ